MKDLTLMENKHILILRSMHSVSNSILNYYKSNQTSLNLNESDFKISFLI
jgi:hypothetical protein